MITPDELAATHAAAFAAERPWSAAEFAEILPGAIVTGDATSFVLGRVVLDEAEILTLATHPVHRRQGLAARALAAFLSAAQGAGARSVFLEVAADNTAARALYARAGFVQAGVRRGYYRRSGGAVDALLLRHNLGQAASDTLA